MRMKKMRMGKMRERRLMDKFFWCCMTDKGVGVGSLHEGRSLEVSVMVWVQLDGLLMCMLIAHSR